MSFNIVRQDIIKLRVDVIVNAANTDLLRGGGVCGAIFKAAGEKDLEKACKALRPIGVGQAVITPGFNLPAKYIIHTAGPVYRGGNEDEDRLLYLAYKNSLELAMKKGCQSIAFPLISSGIYGYPKDKALEIAVSAIKDFLQENDIHVSLVVYDKSAFKLSKELLGEVKSYIDDKYVDENKGKGRYLLNLEKSLIYEGEVYQVENLKLRIDEKLEESFSQMLLKLIDEKNMTDVEVYKKANIDRRLFSKIRTGNNYIPSKKTILALAIGLELPLDEVDALLERAGYALSHGIKFDVIVEYFIINGKYDIFEINQVLFEYDQPLLGS